jgi:thioredoxin-related protein
VTHSCARLVAGLALLLFVTAPAARPAVAGEIGWRGWDSGLREARAAGRPVLVDVYTDWCGWCKRMDRDVYARAEVRDYLAQRFVTVRLNAEAGDAARYDGRSFTSRTLAAYFRVNGYPTTIFLDPNGGHLANVPGYVAPDRFMQLLRYIGDGHYERGVSFQDFARKSRSKR